MLTNLLVFRTRAYQHICWYRAIRTGFVFRVENIVQQFTVLKLPRRQWYWCLLLDGLSWCRCFAHYELKHWLAILPLEPTRFTWTEAASRSGGTEVVPELLDAGRCGEIVYVSSARP
jgi:hypothetical protein